MATKPLKHQKKRFLFYIKKYTFYLRLGKYVFVCICLLVSRIEQNYSKFQILWRVGQRRTHHICVWRVQRWKPGISFAFLKIFFLHFSGLIREQFMDLTENIRHVREWYLRVCAMWCRSKWRSRPTESKRVSTRGLLGPGGAVRLSVPFWFDNVAPAPATFRIYVFNEAYLMHVYVHEGVSMSYYLQRRFICETPCTRHIPSVGKCRIKCWCVSVGGKSLLVKIATGCPAIMSSVWFWLQI